MHKFGGRKKGEELISSKRKNTRRVREKIGSSPCSTSKSKKGAMTSLWDRERKGAGTGGNEEGPGRIGNEPKKKRTGTNKTVSNLFRNTTAVKQKGSENGLPSSKLVGGNNG